MGPLPAASLVVCSRNRPALLAETVASILAGDEVPAELIVVDQSDARHPTLPTLATDRPCAIRYHWRREVGLSRANNAGIALARHHLLAFTHDDVRVTGEWFGTLICALVAAGPRAIVTGQVRPTEEERPGGFQLTIITAPAPATYAGRIGEDVLYPLNMALYRTAAEAVGGFDVRLGPGTPFPAAEDNDFGFRLLEAGYRILYVPTAALYHRAWRPPGDFFRLRWSYGRGQGAYYTKHARLSDRYMLRRFRWDLWRHATRVPGRFWRRDLRRANGDLAYIVGLLAGALHWLWLTRAGTR